LLIANFIVTAALSGWRASLILVCRSIRAGGSHGGDLAWGHQLFRPKTQWQRLNLAGCAGCIVVVATIAFSAPHLNLAHLEPRHTDLGRFGAVRRSHPRFERLWSNRESHWRHETGSECHTERAEVTRSYQSDLPWRSKSSSELLTRLGDAVAAEIVRAELTAHRRYAAFLGEHYAAWSGEYGSVMGFLFSSAPSSAFCSSVPSTPHRRVDWRDLHDAQDGEMHRNSRDSTSTGCHAFRSLQPLQFRFLSRSYETFEALRAYMPSALWRHFSHLGACTFNKRSVCECTNTDHGRTFLFSP